MIKHNLEALEEEIPLSKYEKVRKQRDIAEEFEFLDKLTFQKSH